MIGPGQRTTIVIEKPAAGGRMIGRINGQVALVAGAIPGETVTAEIERVAKGVLYARAIAVETPSPDRRAPFTDPLCGGSLYAHIAYPRQLAIKGQVVADALARLGRLPRSSPPPVAASAESGYRMRARLHVRAGRTGFFREGTHQICDARGTRQLLSETCTAVERVVDAVGAGRPVREAEVEVSESADGASRVIHVDGEIEPHLPADPIEGVSGVTARIALRAHGSAAPPLRTLYGNPYVTDELEIEGRHVRLRRHVLAFFQGNRYLLRDLVAHVVSHIEPENTVADLYAGVGLFAVSAAVLRGVRVVAVEADRVAADDLAENAGQTGGRVGALRRPVESLRASDVAPSTVILDPPRTGASRAAIDAMLRLGARTIVYVSCDPATLARDARRIVDAGYELGDVTAFDLFPNTPHVETVAVFDRSVHL